MRRITKTDGWVIAKVPSGSLLYRMVYYALSSYENRPYEAWYSMEKWREIFLANGYKNVEVKKCGSLLEGIMNRIRKDIKKSVCLPFTKIGRVYFLIIAKK